MSSLLEHDTFHWTLGHTLLRSHGTPAPTMLPSLRREWASLCLPLLNECTTLHSLQCFWTKCPACTRRAFPFQAYSWILLAQLQSQEKEKLHTPTDSEKTSPPHPTRGLLRLYTKNSTVNFLQATDHSFKASAPHPNPTMQNHRHFSI